MQKKPKVTIGDIKAYFINLADMYCPLTEQLVYSGYQQRNGGLKYFTLHMGGEWTGEDPIDDYC